VKRAVLVRSACRVSLVRAGDGRIKGRKHALTSCMILFTCRIYEIACGVGLWPKCSSRLQGDRGCSPRRGGGNMAGILVGARQLGPSFAMWVPQRGRVSGRPARGRSRGVGRGCSRSRWRGCSARGAPPTPPPPAPPAAASPGGSSPPPPPPLPSLRWRPARRWRRPARQRAPPAPSRRHAWCFRGDPPWPHPLPPAPPSPSGCKL